MERVEARLTSSATGDKFETTADEHRAKRLHKGVADDSSDTFRCQRFGFHVALLCLPQAPSNERKPGRRRLKTHRQCGKLVKRGAMRAATKP